MTLIITSLSSSLEGTWDFLLAYGQEYWWLGWMGFAIGRWGDWSEGKSCRGRRSGSGLGGG